MNGTFIQNNCGYMSRYLPYSSRKGDASQDVVILLYRLDNQVKNKNRALSIRVKKHQMTTQNNLYDEET